VAGIEGASALPRRLTGAELSGLVAGAGFAVGLDTGIMHLAAAYGIPGVTLFGPTEPAYATPYGPDQRAVRSVNPHSPCQQVRCSHGPETCMDMLSYDAAWDATRAMLSGLPAQAPA
jgi:heptosyltransferase-1